MRLRNSIHNTNPLVLHCPGPRRIRHRVFKQAVERIMDGPPRQLGCPPDLTIITWLSQPDMATPLTDGLNHWGIPYKPLWAVALWENWLKIPLTLGAANACKTEYMLGIDATDAVMVGNPWTLLNRWRGMGLPAYSPHKILFAAESNNYPPGRDMEEAKQAELAAADGLPFCFLNSGVFIGETDAVRRLYRRAMEEPRSKRRPDSDQGVLRKFYWKEDFGIQLDRRCELFQVAAGRYDAKDVCELVE